ncbi:MAG TPA: IS4 family transposase, partial [Candidatus Competibacter sp.]|nr:IS4 family transposase [Candidatus Competibacter sp.]
DRIVWIGEGTTRQQVRLIEVQAHGTVHRYLTNALDLTRLPTAQAVAPYPQRWRVEDAFAIVKRLLGLAYFHRGAENAIKMQVWATWLLYAVLIDLTDAVAEALAWPFADLSPAMLYRSLYFVTHAVAQDSTTDPVRYLADHARELGIIKRPRKPHIPPPTPLVSTLTIAEIP